MQKFGYIRVSTKEQHVDRQITALVKAGVDEKNIYIDKISGKDFERPRYKRLLRKLKAGDVLVVKDIKRLGRNYDEILENWRLINKNIGADIIIYDMPLLDTTKYRDLLGTLISDIVLQVLSFAAQNEREDILLSQAEGIIEAHKRGVRFGRPPKEQPPDYAKIKGDYETGVIKSSRAAAEKLGVSQRTFLKWIKQ